LPDNPVLAWHAFIFQNKLNIVNVEACASPLETNLRLAKQLAVKTTPTLFFTNGKRVLGLVSSKEIEQRILDAEFYSN
jgi:thiol:disulfide interchange protein DsbC